MEPVLETVLKYVEAINAGDPDALYELATEDYLFIDSHDNRVVGKDNMHQSWIGYFAMFPDYKIEIDRTVTEGSVVCILGYASGTYKNLKNEENSNYWRAPAAWTAVVEAGKVKLWQVYCDNTFAIAIYNRNESIPWG